MIRTVFYGYVEIIVSRYKDSYLTTSIMESKRVFSWLMWISFCWFPVEADRDHYIIYQFTFLFWVRDKRIQRAISSVHCWVYQLAFFLLKLPLL